MNVQQMEISDEDDTCGTSGQRSDRNSIDSTDFCTKCQ